MASSVSTSLDLIDTGAVALPEFQRGYVWNRDQVRGFMRSLYRRYPVGSLLVWRTPADSAPARGSHSSGPGYVDLLLDGQQRITTLYGIVRGRAPQFFEGNAQSFSGLHFSLEDETFEFYAPQKMKRNPLWVDVTTVMQSGMAAFLDGLNTAELQPQFANYVKRLTQLEGIKDIKFHQEDEALLTYPWVHHATRRPGSGGQ